MAMRHDIIKDVIKQLISEQSSSVAASHVLQGMQQIKRDTLTSVNNFGNSSGVDFAGIGSMSIRSYAGKRNPSTGFIWGADTWGDGVFSFEDASSSNTTAQGGVDTNYLNRGERGGVVRRW